MKEKNNGSKYFLALYLLYGGLHVPPNVSVSEVIYALGILFITLYVVFRALNTLNSFKTIKIQICLIDLKT